jgi:ribosomal protein L19E
MKPIIRAGLIVESRAAAHTRTKRMHAWFMALREGRRRKSTWSLTSLACKNQFEIEKEKYTSLYRSSKLNYDFITIVS